MQPLLAIEAGEAAPASGPENAVGAGCEASDALMDFRRQRHIHELKRALCRTGCFEVLRVGDPDAAVGREARAGGKRLGSRDFFGAESCRVKTSQSPWITEDPDGAIGGENHFAGKGAVEAVLRSPDSPVSSLGIPHSDTIVGADPESLALIAQFGPSHVIGKTFSLRPTGPGFAASPALDAGAAEANPIRALAVLGDGKGGVDGHAAALVNDLPLSGAASIESCDRGDHEIAGTIQGG